ncbi:hypothetical protein SEVIR_4G301700v4 [Setaria viridis]|uniref:Uncharacterized protein n=2 Tax=Setaria TaxID=4554 RepID=A0A368QZP5_SETIT|nr:gibberellin-regulated protein 2-like [Setaria italica]XP_034590480.1 gibberellin-regulated protein 2-like [Setaria viridis]RCV23314.1 hypothetical protein SETIT_4G289400v2 [Setaria italica]TKW23594.1 hypothetical protein SEVIR_4G301700v2 [Setaria viridis]
MKKQQQILFLVVVFILMVVLADDDLKQLQVKQQLWSTSRSLLQQAPPKIDCPSACVVRCANNWKNEMCNKMCNVCCNHCSCVPPGTGQDTRHLCPCYDTMVNPHTKKLKCP